MGTTLLSLRIILIFVLSSIFSHAQAGYYAIVVGVSEYPFLAGRVQLEGPENDALLVNHMLLQQGFKKQNIAILTDDDESDLPTRANIVNSFNALAKKVKPGDFVYVHMSGHGSQQPTQSPADEPDGFDEIFLPRDVKKWDFSAGHVPNSLSDNDIKSLVDSLRVHGADVWAVFDTCHSGTLTRSIGSAATRYRGVEPVDLGLPAKAAQKGNRTSEIRISTEQAIDREIGDLVAFYAAQSFEDTPEMQLQSDTGKSVTLGLFTHTLATLIARNETLSYRSLAQRILNDYNARPWYQTTPLFEGASNKRIFHRDGESVSRFTVAKNRERFSVLSGTLSGVESGAVLSVYESPVSNTEVAQLQVTQASMTTANATLLNGTVNSNISYAVIKRPALPRPVSIKWLTKPTRIWNAAQKSLHDEKRYLNNRIEWAGSQQHADLLLHADREYLYFFTGDTQLPCSLITQNDKDDCAQTPDSFSRIQVTASDFNDVDTLTNMLRTGLGRAVRAINLLRLATVLTDADSRLETSATLTQPDNPSKPLAVTGLKLHNARANAVLDISFKNTDKASLDVTMFFIDNHFGIYQVYPKPDVADSERLKTGEVGSFQGIINADSVGIEQVLLIATAASRGSPPLSLAHIVQPSMQHGAIRSAGSFVAPSAHTDYFSQAMGLAASTRGPGRAKPKTTIQSFVHLFRWRTLAH